MSGTGAFDFVRGFTRTTLTAILLSDETTKPAIRAGGKSGRPDLAKRKPNQSEESEKSDTQESEPADQGTNVVSTVDPSGSVKVPDSADISKDAAEVSDAGKKAESGPTPDTPLVPPITVPPAVNPENKTAILKSTREKLSYSLYWLGIYVGSAELEAVSSDGKVTIKSQVHSAPVISAFYTVEDYSESKVINGLPVNFRIKQHEGKYRSDKETFFDLDNQHIIFNDYLKGTKDDYSVKGGELWDLISGFYYLRTQHFEVGKTIYIDIFDSKKFFTAEVSILGKEKIKFAKNEELDTVKVKPLLKSEGLFQNKGDILIWLTDDDNKIPVKIETKVPIGKVVAILTSTESE